MAFCAAIMTLFCVVLSCFGSFCSVLSCFGSVLTRFESVVFVGGICVLGVVLGRDFSVFTFRMDLFGDFSSDF